MVKEHLKLHRHDLLSFQEIARFQNLGCNLTVINQRPEFPAWHCPPASFMSPCHVVVFPAKKSWLKRVSTARDNDTALIRTILTIRVQAPNPLFKSVNAVIHLDPAPRNPEPWTIGTAWARGHDGKTIVAIDQRFLADFEFVAVCSAWVLIVSPDGQFLVLATVFRQTFCQGSSIFDVSIQITWGLKNVMPKCIANQGTLSYRVIKCQKPIEPWGFSSHIREEWAASRFPYSPATLIMSEAVASRHELRWGCFLGISLGGISMIF